MNFYFREFPFTSKKAGGFQSPSASADSAETYPQMTPMQLIVRVVGVGSFVVAAGVFSTAGATALVSYFSTGAFLPKVVVMFEALKAWATVGTFLVFSTMALFAGGLAHHLSYILEKVGLNQLPKTLTGSCFPAGVDSLDRPESTYLNLSSSFDRDLDFFSSTDFEDLLVFALDALELLWQDVNLLVELCGENAFFVGVGLGFAGFSWISKKVFSTKRLKK